MQRTFTWETDDRLYMVGPVTETDPAETASLKDKSPSKDLLWLSGQFVEAEVANRNGQVWATDDLVVRQVEPINLPVTIMHDPSTAVGVIADTKLLTPARDGVDFARLDTTLAIWAHRFPEIAEEVAHNLKNGTMMQSFEAICMSYSCDSCGKEYVKEPNGAERANWCSHLRETGKRRLGGSDSGLRFTGTGLIFGSRGSVGANPKAYMESAAFQAEVAEFHQRSQQSNSNKRRTSKVDEITIKRSEYDELKAEAGKAVTLAARVSDLEPLVAEKAELVKAVEAAEIAQKAAVAERDAAKAEAEGLKETARAANLSSDRLGKLGSAFKAKLTDNIVKRLTEQAKTLSDEAWTERLEELAELTGVKADEAAPAGSTFTPAETAALGSLGGNGGAPVGVPSREAQSAVLSGLFRSTRPQAPSKPGK